MPVRADEGENMKERKLRAKKLQSCSRNLRHNATLQERILWGRLRDKRMGLNFAGRP